MKDTNKTDTIKKNSDFQIVFEKGHSINGKYLVVYFHPNKWDYRRFGFCVGRKIGSAVRRNRIKRLLRVAIRSITHSVPMTQPTQFEWDVVVVARTPIIKAPLTDIISDLKQILSKKGLIKAITVPLN